MKYLLHLSNNYFPKKKRKKKKKKKATPLPPKKNFKALSVFTLSGATEIKVFYSTWHNSCSANAVLDSRQSKSFSHVELEIKTSCSK